MLSGKVRWRSDQKDFHLWQGAMAAKWNAATSLESHLHEWPLSAWRGARQPAGTGNNPGCSPVAAVHRRLPSRSWRGARWARLCARTFSLWERPVGLHEHTEGCRSGDMLRRWSLTCQVLLNVRAVLQEPGPSQRPSVEHSYVLVHHFFVGLIVVRSLEAIGVDPAGASPHSLHTSGLLGHNAAAAEWLCQKTHLSTNTLTFTPLALTWRMVEARNSWVFTYISSTRLQFSLGWLVFLQRGDQMPPLNDQFQITLSYQQLKENLQQLLGWGGRRDETMLFPLKDSPLRVSGWRVDWWQHRKQKIWEDKDKKKH